jgi:hypothetical protein
VIAAFALGVPFGEPVDFLHALPKQTKTNKPRRRAAMIVLESAARADMPVNSDSVSRLEARTIS